MNMPITIWTVFSTIEIIAAIVGTEDYVKPSIATLVFWIASVALILTGHINFFAALNVIPALFLFLIGGLDLLVAPPGSDTSKPQSYFASGIIRVSFVLASWYTF